LSKGDKLPPLSLKNQDGREVKLSKFFGRPLVLYFYPANETPGCTKQVLLMLFPVKIVTFKYTEL